LVKSSEVACWFAGHAVRGRSDSSLAGTSKLFGCARGQARWLRESTPSLDFTLECRAAYAGIILTTRGRDVVMTSFLEFVERYAKKLHAGRNPCWNRLFS
jgi:hypothetical protein